MTSIALDDETQNDVDQEEGELYPLEVDAERQKAKMRSKVPSQADSIPAC